MRIRSFGVPFGNLLGSIFHDVFMHKMHRLFNLFVESFWADLGSLDPPKLGSRARETLIFGKL